jgi:hypothetical protein
VSKMNAIRNTTVEAAITGSRRTNGCGPVDRPRVLLDAFLLPWVRPLDVKKASKP